MKFIKQFLRLEASAGLFLVMAALLAILFRNSSLQGIYDKLLNFPLGFHVFGFALNKSLLVWVNDFLMSFFFLMIGLELKREKLEGHLKKYQDALLPAIAALGGLIFPSLIYIFFTQNHPDALEGWAIPAATDIAFSLGVLALLSKRIPRSLKICLLSLAIFDDIAAILIIAVFYTHEISAGWLLSVLIPLSLLATLNYKRVTALLPYLILGLILWLCILKSGIHATIAGILLGIFIPLKTDLNHPSPLKKLEHQLHPWVSFAILPLFAFFNAGVPIRELSLRAITHPIAAGITFGLFFGKQLGVMLFSCSAIKLKICSLPANTTFMQFYGMAVVTGIGFTMSLFIGALSFSDPEYQNLMRLGVMGGSILSGSVGYLILLYATHKPRMN